MGDIHARIYVCSMSILNYGRGSKHLWGSFSDTSQIPQIYYSSSVLWQVVVHYYVTGNTKTRGKIFVLETFKMFCWFYAAQAHISCGGATALWMELVECFPNKLGKLLCANSCETNDKIICHTNQCTTSITSTVTP